MMLAMSFEIIIQGFHGKTLVTFEQCKLYNGQVMIDETCEKKTKCLDRSIFMKTCAELRE